MPGPGEDKALPRVVTSGEPAGLDKDTGFSPGDGEGSPSSRAVYLAGPRVVSPRELTTRDVTPPTVAVATVLGPRGLAPRTQGKRVRCHQAPCGAQATGGPQPPGRAVQARRAAEEGERGPGVSAASRGLLQGAKGKPHTREVSLRPAP